MTHGNGKGFAELSVFSVPYLINSVLYWFTISMKDKVDFNRLFWPQRKILNELPCLKSQEDRHQAGFLEKQTMGSKLFTKLYPKTGLLVFPLTAQFGFADRVIGFLFSLVGERIIDVGILIHNNTVKRSVRYVGK